MRIAVILPAAAVIAFNKDRRPINPATGLPRGESVEGGPLHKIIGRGQVIDLGPYHTPKRTTPPVPPKQYGPPPGYGGTVGPTVHLTVNNHNHFNGADHQTQEHLATKVGKKVQEHISKALKDSHLYGGLMPAGLEPDLWGAM